MLYLFIDLTVSNAYACFKADCPENNLDFLQFKTQVSHSLMRKNDLGPRAELDLASLCSPLILCLMKFA